MGMLAGGFFSQGGLLDFSPTYNGAQDPTELDDSYADYEYSNLGPGASAAEAECRLVVQNSSGDSIITISGSEDGSGVDQGSYAAATADVFELNTRPDTVTIKLESESYSDSDHSNYPSTTSKVGTFTDDAAFDPTNGVDYGYRADADVESSDPAQNPPTTSEDGEMISVISFTFKKAGYNDLTVTYKIKAAAVSMSGDES